MADQPQKRQWRNFLLDGRMQLRYALLVTGVSAAVAVVLGMLIYQQSTVASTQIIASLDAPGMEWLDDATKVAVRAQLGQSDMNLVATMIAVGFGLALILLASLILTTHRVVGPLYRMALHFDELRQGKLLVPGILRRGDQFLTVFASLRETHEALRQRAQADIDAIEGFLDSVGESGSPTFKSALAELRELHDEKKLASRD